MDNSNLRPIIISCGEKFPKKHGEWYRLHVFDDNYLICDTWNGQIDHHKIAEPSDTNNMYGVVYAFSGRQRSVRGHMNNFWYAHICHLKN